MNNEFEKLRESWLDFEEFKKEFQKVEVVEYPNNVLDAVPNPEVSVRITTYQHGPYIKEAIESVLMQELDVPWEIIIGDDESTDGTREICIEYAKKYPNLIRLFLHKRENNIKVLSRPTPLFQWMYNCYNLRGTYVAGCGGDDYWTDEYKLQKQYSIMKSDSNIAYCCHDYVQLFTGTNQEVLVTNAQRTQTILGKNIFNKLPVELTKIMQEDTFSKFLWKIIGRVEYNDDVLPSYVRFHSESMYTSLGKLEVFEQRVNLWENIIKMSKLSPNIKFIAKEKLFKVIITHYKSDGLFAFLKNFHLFSIIVIKFSLIKLLLYYIPKIFR
jgi:glycosyltransferase involved in cell wall biosynthesis